MSPLQIFKLAEENKIILFTDEVENVLKNSVLKDRKVCVISVAGIFRQGKSFVLNFFLHFLKKKVILFLIFHFRFFALLFFV